MFRTCFAPRGTPLCLGQQLRGRNGRFLSASDRGTSTKEFAIFIPLPRGRIAAGPAERPIDRRLELQAEVIRRQLWNAGTMNVDPLVSGFLLALTAAVLTTAGNRLLLTFQTRAKVREELRQFVRELHPDTVDTQWLTLTSLCGRSDLQRWLVRAIKGALKPSRELSKTNGRTIFSAGCAGAIRSPGP